jgi:hypothetical protein
MIDEQVTDYTQRFGSLSGRRIGDIDVVRGDVQVTEKG